MSETIEVFGLFPVPVYAVSNIKILKKIKNELSKIEYERVEINNGWMSKNKNVLDDELFSNLKTTITNHIYKFAKEVLKISDKLEFKITQSWIMKHQQNDWAQVHHHKNSLFSGVVYLDVDGTTGDILFHRNNVPSFNFSTMCVDFEYENFNFFNSDFWKFIPKDGDLFLFPSLLPHSVSVNKLAKIRYSLAFNVFISGSIGNQNNLNHLIV